MQRSNNCPLRLIMHPFCCVSTVNNDLSSSALPDLPPPPSMPSEISSASSSGRRSDSNDVGRRSQRTVVPTSAAAESGPPRPGPAPQPLLSGDQREVKINDLVGSGISGVLYKWVNYGKGWRPRWFVLQDGVLSYYKIHGPDKIVVSQVTEKGSRVIGEDSQRRMSRQKTGGTQLRRKPVGEVHLKTIAVESILTAALQVSSIRESRSDDKRFSIFTGTKRLHLRAETRDDRMAWMDALQAVKDMFPRLSNSELMAPVDNVVVSTEKLRQRLLEEGLSEAAIQDSEQIVRSEFAVLQSQLMVLKQKHWFLLDTLRQLEIDELQWNCDKMFVSNAYHLHYIHFVHFLIFNGSTLGIVFLILNSFVTLSYLVGLLFLLLKKGSDIAGEMLAGSSNFVLRFMFLWSSMRCLSFVLGECILASDSDYNFYYKERKATIDTRSAQKAGFHGGVVKVLPSNTIDRSVNEDVMVGNLQTEKVDLENTVVDESQRQLKELEPSSGLRQDKSSEGTASDSEDDHERGDAAEEETDDDENAFFDTRDFLSSSSFKSSGSDLRTSSFSSDEELYSFESEDDVDPSIKSVGKNFPHVKRRKRLPEPVEKEKGVSLWSMIKDNIGKDLTKVCLPVYFNEPLSSLQKCFEDLEYSYLIDRAYEWGKRGNSLMRILNVAAFAVSGYASTEGRHCKPFNPLLGETYEAEYPDKGLRFFSEKVSHHPMIVACHCEGTGWKFWGDSNLKSKFWGRSIQLDPVGVLTLEFDDGEVFQWSKVTTSIYNLILGKLYCDHYGTMRVEGNHNYSCKLKFKEQSIIDRNPHQVQGIVQDKNGKTVATLFGKWDESLYYMNGESSGKGKGTEVSEAHLLWKRSKPPKFPTRYNLTRFAITLNELTSQLKEKLPPTDSRLRPDQRCLENGEYDMANSEKLRLEQRQRQARKMQESGWKPKWFAKEKGSDTYRYIGGYWEAREKRSWDSCPDIFGHFPSDQVSE
ncbi:hypothetical protein RHSIM_Rhsim11G0065900 [Rhododendron simsii]|uniref:PH domain-containing protein n=1 Tax=Rhododendron simsii TaxID=118357 RepID=A0A834G7N8_RHOSS|nr:hypothetical protein RHSIM_Rhsim11G0065900 [Rhododendron simsii]